MARLKILSTAQRMAVVIAAVFYIAAGSLHFIRPAPYLRIMPPYISWHGDSADQWCFRDPRRARAADTGNAERSGVGLVALLIAVFPANLYMAMHPVEAGAASIMPVLRWGRLPVQALLIWWLLWCTRPRYVLR